MPEPARQAPKWFERRPWKDVFEVNLAVFQAFLIIYLVLLLLETLREGSVTRFLPLNGILLVVLVTGVAAVLTTKEQQEPERPLRRRDYVLVGLIAVGSWLILWYQLRDLGWIQYPVSLLGGLLVGLVSLSVLLPEKPEEEPVTREPAQPEPIRAEPPLEAPRPPKAYAAPRSPPGARIRFKCPTCATPGSLPIEKAGARVKCPKCATVFPAN